jgi:hypothetical protein
MFDSRTENQKSFGEKRLLFFLPGVVLINLVAAVSTSERESLVRSTINGDGTRMPNVERIYQRVKKSLENGKVSTCHSSI